MKPFVKCLCIALSIAVLVVAGYLCYSITISIQTEKMVNRTYLMEELISPDGAHKVSVLGVGEPKWSFGCHNIAIRFDDKDVELHMKVYNDGREAEIGHISWTASTVEVPISGRNSPLRNIVFTFDDDGVSVKIS